MKRVRSRQGSGGKPAVRAWQRMLSGRRLDLLDPSPLDVEVEDIAHGLARVARWNGQTTGAHIFSVAQVPAETPLSKQISTELVRRGFKFVGPTIVYAFMQATGMVNDHLVTCHRHAQCAELGHGHE